MTLGTFLKKDFNWSRHRLVTMVVLFIGVPAVIATGTLFFEHTLPENSPVAVVPANDRVSQNDLEIVSGALTLVSDPRVVNSSAEAHSQLRREEVYAIVAVPPDIAEQGRNATIRVTVHGAVTIYRLPSRALVTLLADSLDGALPSNISATRRIIGDSKSLSEYLLPTFAMITLMLVAFIYVPYNLASEAAVFDRLRIKSRLEWLIAAKIVFFLLLIVPSLLTVYLVGVLLGYSLQPLSLPALAIFMLTFLYLTALSVTIMLLTEFSNAGRILNVVAFFVLVPTSNLAYPAGFFSPLSKSIARHNPLHHSMIVARSHLLKDVPTGMFADWFGWLALVTVASFAVLELSIKFYEYRQ